MRLYKFLNELQFISSKDRDYPVKSNSVIIFDENDNYKVKGKTHNESSHAIKHLFEFDKNFYDKVIYDVKRYIQNKNFYTLNKKGNINPKPDTIGYNIIINTLDRINDKIVNNQTLTTEEQYLSKYIDMLTKRYISVIDNMLSDSVNVDNMSLERIMGISKPIIFTSSDTSQTKYIVDLDKLIFGVKDSEGVRTFFTYKNLTKLKEKVLSKDLYNKDVIEFFKQF